LADTPDFERSLSELESLVERLERGDLPLEDALQTFERGVELTRHCQSSLKAAQQKVEILLKRSGQSGIEGGPVHAEMAQTGMVQTFSVPEDGAGQE
jgi:exodeoxyribonuclease VII small subunit